MSAGGEKTTVAPVVATRPWQALAKRPTLRRSGGERPPRAARDDQQDDNSGNHEHRVPQPIDRGALGDSPGSQDR